MTGPDFDSGYSEEQLAINQQLEKVNREINALIKVHPDEEARAELRRLKSEIGTVVDDFEWRVT